MGSSFLVWPVVAIAFVVGLTFALASGKDRIPVVVYPTPDNAGKVEYVDRAGTCHVFKHVEAECGKSPKPKEIPAQLS